jgi:SAM-dependent methyltransferase
MMKRDNSLTCLLCGSSDKKVLATMSANEILTCWALEGPAIPDPVVADLKRVATVDLFQCDRCGFHFFDPTLAASGAFYHELHARGPGYYATGRPENERNARFAVERGYRRILDIGCGTGVALDVAKSKGLETFGIELSRSAAEEAARRGHRIFPCLLEELESSWEGGFDLISLNQVLEHVPDPVGLIRQCLRFLSPAGVVAIAVPGAEGLLRFTPWLESNWPPHHVSRWRQKDFYTLAERTGMRVVRTGGDRLLGAGIEQILLGHRKRALALGKPYGGLPPFLVTAVSQVYRKTGLKWLFPAQGASVFGFLSR